MNVDVATTVADQAVRRAAVLGSPIEHSLSPVLHGAAYQALDLHGWRYDKIECDEPGLSRLVGGMGPEWAGLSLTMPLKRVVMTVADEVSPLAEAVGAANTLVFSPAGGTRADNTDVAGMTPSIDQPRQPADRWGFGLRLGLLSPAAHHDRRPDRAGRPNADRPAP